MAAIMDVEGLGPRRRRRSLGDWGTAAVAVALADEAAAAADNDATNAALLRAAGSGGFGVAVVVGPRSDGRFHRNAKTQWLRRRRHNSTYMPSCDQARRDCVGSSTVRPSTVGRPKSHAGSVTSSS
jgi:hypothetical protein